MTVSAHDEATMGCYALGVLDEHERRAVEQHLSRCGGCRAQVADFSQLRFLLDEIPREVFFEELGVPHNGPKPSELVLQRALRQIRSEGATRSPVPQPRASPEPKAESAPSPGQHRRKPRYVVAAAVVAAMAFGAGAIVQGMQPKAPPAVGEVLAKTAQATDAATGVKLVADVSPAQGSVKLRAEVTGLPAGQKCRLIVVSRDGRREVAGSWTSSVKAKTEGGVVNGEAAVSPEDVEQIVVENSDGKKFVVARV